jgi:hypothetical protein
MWQTAEIINSVGLIFAGIGLFLTWWFIRENTKTREIQMLNDTFRSIKETERELYSHYKGKDEQSKKEWDSMLFNSIEQFAFLVNNKFIKNQKLTSFFDDAIIMWYESIFLKNSDDAIINDDKQYSEFKKLYHTIKKRDEKYG